jgi:hypothetical protein
LIEATRTDLIGSGCYCLIPANPPKDAIEARRRQANRVVNGDVNDHYHTVANPAKGKKLGERGPNRRRQGFDLGGSRRSDGRGNERGP